MDNETMGTVKISTLTGNHTLTGVGASEFSRGLKAWETSQPVVSLTTADRSRTLALPFGQITSMQWTKEN